MSRRLCCCVHDCTVFSDDFDGPDSTNLGSDWDERSGDWETVGNELAENGTDGAIVICQTPTVTKEQSVGVRILDITDGLQPGIVCNYVDDNNYFFTEFEHSGSGSAMEVRFYRRSGGVDSLLHGHLVPPLDADPEANRGVQVCFSRTSFSVMSGDVWIAFVADPAFFTSGKKAGLRNGGAGAITLDEFTLQNFDGEDSEADFGLCCVQQCHCIEDGNRYSISHDLILTLFFSDCLGNGSVDIPLTWNPVQQHWESEVGQPPGIFDLDNRWVLKCGQSACVDTSGRTGTFVLTSDYDGNPGCDQLLDICFSFDEAQTAFTCEPLIIEFVGRSWPDDIWNTDPCGPCGVARDMSTAGGYYGTVTEA